MCDRKVWVHLLNQTEKFPLKKLKELVNFVPEKSRLDLMPEVLKAAASKFPSSERENPAKIIWTVRGCPGAPQTMDMKPNNVEKLQIVAKTVGVSFNILKVESFSFSPGYFAVIANYVELQGEKLENFEGDQIDTKEDFFLLQRMSMRWKLKCVRVDLGGWVATARLKLNDLAGSSLDNVHINMLAVHMKGRVQVSLNALKRVWEIADQMRILNYSIFNYSLQPVLDLEVGGGRGEDREAAWQLVLNFLHGNNNAIEVIE